MMATMKIGHMVGEVCPFKFPYERKREMSTEKRCKGFTVVELLATVGIAAIMVSLAVPSFQNLIMNGRRTSHINSFVAAMAYAKSEAIKGGGPVSVCSKSATEETCSGDTVWDSGWLIYVDYNINGIVDPEEEILKVRGVLEGNGTLRATSLGSISFLGSGFPQFAPNTDTSINYCDTRGISESRVLRLSLTGRVTTDHPATTCP